MWLSLLVAILVLWYQDHQRLQNELVGKQAANGGESWSIDQVKGKPNTTPFGDISTAWASRTQDGQLEWIIAEFPSTMKVTEIRVFETYNPGALYQITSVSMRGSESIIWTGNDPAQNINAGGRADIKLSQPVNTRRIKLYLNSPAVSGWNEIDAIALIDKNGNAQWVSDAWASSSYGMNRVRPNWFWP